MRSEQLDGPGTRWGVKAAALVDSQGGGGGRDQAALLDGSVFKGVVWVGLSQGSVTALPCLINNMLLLLYL